jgi:Na(+)-translocating NADH:ubiquinone oxidoreductase F subunit
VKATEREIVYVGGGAGMAPLRSHISWLFDSCQTKRKVSFWYGARSKAELFYDDYFTELSGRPKNFLFNVALSESQKKDNWDSYMGYIHEVLEREFLSRQNMVSEKEYYLCGPPEMVKAVQKVLAAYKVPETQISFDEF